MSRLVQRDGKWFVLITEEHEKNLYMKDFLNQQRGFEYDSMDGFAAAKFTDLAKALKYQEKLDLAKSKEV